MLLNVHAAGVIVLDAKTKSTRHRRPPSAGSQALDGRIDRTNKHLATASKRLTSTRAEVAKLDKVILTTPDKALSVPLLRRDLDNQIVAGLRHEGDSAPGTHLRSRVCRLNPATSDKPHDFQAFHR